MGNWISRSQHVAQCPYLRWHKRREEKGEELGTGLSLRWHWMTGCERGGCLQWWITVVRVSKVWEHVVKTKWRSENLLCIKGIKRDEEGEKNRMSHVQPSCAYAGLCCAIYLWYHNWPLGMRSKKLHLQSVLLTCPYVYFLPVQFCTPQGHMDVYVLPI